MFGYVRPMKDELKVREFDRFRGVYCGLCHTLKRRYGAFARFALRFDYTFLAMLLTAPGGEGCDCKGRCMASPLRKKRYCGEDAALDSAADVSMILLQHKLADTAADDGFWKALGARLLKLLFWRKFRRARQRAPAFSEHVGEQMAALQKLEKENCPSMDAAADPFARLLSETGSFAGDGEREKICTQLLYQLGRLVYLLDACDDLKDDTARGLYNPLCQRFGLEKGALDEGAKQTLRETLRCSCGIIAADFELLPRNAYSEILTNIIYLGLPQAVELVLAGKWEKDKRRET